MQLNFIKERLEKEEERVYFEASVSPTKKLILAKAIDLFARDGYSNASMRDLARAVGIKPASIYNHFESKAAILSAVFEQMMSFSFLTHDDDEIDALIASPLSTREVVRILSSQKRVFKGEEAELFAKCIRIATMEQYTSVPAYDALVDFFLVKMPLYYTHVFDKLMSAGRIPPCDTRGVADILSRVAFAYIIEYSHGNPHFEPDANATPSIWALNNMMFTALLRIE